MTSPTQNTRLDTLRGVVERITFHNEENGYTVAKLAPEQRSDGGGYGFGAMNEVAIIGNMAGINVGESVELTGHWTIHQEYGKQFVVQNMRTVLPATVAGIEKYLGSGLIKGVGKVTAKRIVGHFGVETLNVIDNDPGRLIEVAGVGRKRVGMIRTAWAEQRAIKEVMIFLQSHGVSTSLATKIYKTYGDESIDIVRSDPYRLARDIFGIGFLTADKIAQSLGIAPDAPQRVAAGAAYVLSQATDDGHVFLPVAELIRQAAELLDVAPSQVGVGVLHLQGSDQVKLAASAGADELALDSPLIVGENTPQIIAEQGQLYSTATVDQVQNLLRENPVVYLTPMFYSEVGVSNRLQRLLGGPSALQEFSGPGVDWSTTFRQLELTLGFELAAHQRDGVRAALTHRLTVLTGGPGTGKTTTVRAVLQLCQGVGARVLLAAPTGRAAKRLSETTGQEAKTIHRLLEFQPTEGMSFKRNEEFPLDADLLIVDEASMLDLVLTNHLLRAIPPGMHLLLVGDVDQLPSVGAGNVLKDVIAAIEETTDDGRPTTKASSPLSVVGRHSSVVKLDVIFRQAAGSYIITNAHRINTGQMPTIDNASAHDFFLFKTDDPERAAQLCVELVQTRIPRRFAARTAGRTPRTGRSAPLNPSSAIHTQRATAAAGTCSAEARTARPTARSKREPTLRTSAGSSATVILRSGQLASEFWIAARMRSRDSRTETSGRPVKDSPGSPIEMSHSTSTS